MLLEMEKLGPCHDSKDFFFVEGKSGSMEEKNCEWFAGAPRERCNNHYEGQMECRLTCSFNSPKVCSLMPPKFVDIDPNADVKEGGESDHDNVIEKENIAEDQVVDEMMITVKEGLQSDDDLNVYDESLEENQSNIGNKTILSRFYAS